MTSPQRKPSYVLSQLVAGGIKQVVCDSTGRKRLETCTWFPLDLTPCAFPFADFTLYSFTVFNFSHEYDYAEFCESSGGSPNPGAVLGTLDTEGNDPHCLLASSGVEKSEALICDILFSKTCQGSQRFLKLDIRELTTKKKGFLDYTTILNFCSMTPLRERKSK